MTVKDDAIGIFSLSESDADYLYTHHQQTLTQALNSPLFAHVTLRFIEHPTIPAGWEKIMSGPLSPDDALKSQLKVYFSRIFFVVNTPEFKSLFNSSLDMLKPQANNPANYDEFKAFLIDQMTHQYDFVIEISAFRQIQRANAYGDGVGGLHIYVDADQIMQGTSYNNQGLLLHELMHTAGYAHVGNNDGFNDIPEYVQLLLMPGALNRTTFKTLNDLSHFITRTHSLPANTGSNKDIISHYFG